MITLIIVFVLTALLSAVATNNVAAVLAFPVALAAAGDMGLSVLPFAITIMIAASASFATPIGYQTNLMVQEPGGYTFTDYVRVGLPLTIVVLVVLMLVLPILWPLTP